MSDPDQPLLCWPLDHYYSPVPDHRLLGVEPTRSRVWPAVAKATPGIDWRDEEQLLLLADHLCRQTPMPVPAGPTGDSRDFHVGNEMFGALDGWLLQAVLRHYRPRQMIEVGCGWSSLLTARVNREYLGGSLQFTCIEPYPPGFLAEGVEGITELIEAQVENVPVETFLRLEAGDILFIDTSHTVKTGGDVHYLFSEVVPRLAPGVVVHIHDIFLPRDYPESWVRGGRGWNEQYLVQAFLSFNSGFQIVLGAAWLTDRHRDQLGTLMPGYPWNTVGSGGSLWIRRI
jgi:hypothetical protein